MFKICASTENVMPASMCNFCRGGSDKQIYRLISYISDNGNIVEYTYSYNWQNITCWISSLSDPHIQCLPGARWTPFNEKPVIRKLSLGIKIHDDTRNIIKHMLDKMEREGSQLLDAKYCSPGSQEMGRKYHIMLSDEYGRSRNIDWFYELIKTIDNSVISKNINIDQNNNKLLELEKQNNLLLEEKQKSELQLQESQQLYLDLLRIHNEYKLHFEKITK
jgi:hypothetical protein